MATAEAPPAVLTTAEQLGDLPDDGLRHELVEGVVTTVSPTGARHGRIAARLLLRVGVHVEERRLGEVFAAETGFLIHRGPDTVRAPDVAYVAADRAAEVDVPGFAALAPDLVAEVVSPSDRAVEVAAKARAWVDAGVRLVWVVDPVNHVVTSCGTDGVRVLADDDVLEGADVLPGFSLALSDLFA